jgi:hypothetical protein
VHLLRGNPSKKSAAQLRDAISPDVEIPTCPRHLGAEARKEWKRISVELEKLGLIAQIDRAALSMYCTAWGRHVDAENKIRERGERGLVEPLVELGDTVAAGQPAARVHFPDTPWREPAVVCFERAGFVPGEQVAIARAGTDRARAGERRARSEQTELRGVIHHRAPQRRQREALTATAGPSAASRLPRIHGESSEARRQSNTGLSTPRILCSLGLVVVYCRCTLRSGKM